MKRPMLVAAAAGLLALAACSSTAPSKDGGTAVDDGPIVRAIKSYRFSPAELTVARGADVRWSNDDDFVHNVRLLDGSNTTRDLPIGGSVSIRFDRPGLVRYECSLHPTQMKGSILVE